MHHIPIIQDRFRHYYRVSTPDDTLTHAVLEPECFRDPVLTEQFVRRLNVPASYWRRLLNRFPTEQYGLNSTDEKRISQLLIQGRIKLYRVRHLDKQAQKSTTHSSFPTIPREKGQHYQLAPASVLLVKPTLNTKTFSNKNEAAEFLSDVNLGGNQFDALNASTSQPGRTITNETLAQALLDGTVIAVLQHDSAATRKTATDADVDSEVVPSKPYSLGPHDEGYSSKASTDSLGGFSTEPPFKCTEMESEYAGEEMPGNDVWPGSAVVYLDNRERKEYKLTVDNGKLYDHEGNLFDTSSARSLHPGGNGRAIFVMDEQGNMFASNSHSIGKFHHSSFLGGKPVSAAGEMVVENGNLKTISGRSGHYRPESGYQGQLTSQLKNMKVDMSDLIVEA